MFSLLDRIRFLVAFIFFIFMIQSSASSSLENDKLAQLIERLDRMQSKMDAIQSREEVLEVENAQLTERLDRMQNKMDAINDKWTRKFSDLEAENEKLKTQKIQKDNLPESKWNDGKLSRFLSSPPSSCQQLRDNNYLLPMDGIHLLKKNDKIKVAFCTFITGNNPVSEVLIGQLDVKSKIIHFYVQKNSSFSTVGGTIPFELARLNEGGAFDLSSGVFTVPVPGIYHFDFSALKANTYHYLNIFLQVNGNLIGLAHTNQEVSGTYNQIAMSASLKLAAGDKVNLYNWGNGVLYDRAESHWTHFSGWLVEESLV